MTKQPNLLATLSLFASLAYGSARIELSDGRTLQKRIVGGKPVARGAHPAYAIPAGSRLCGATVIHPDVLLTAAHCKGAFLEGVLIGATQLSGTDMREFLLVEREHPHPDYRPGPEENDIMLVKLDTFSDAPLVEYNLNASVPVLSDALRILGFGATSTAGPSASTLQQVDVEVIANEDCEATLQTQGFAFNNETMLCSSTG